MLLSAVSVLVVAQSSSEIPEGLMNNPVLQSRHKRHYFTRHRTVFQVWLYVSSEPGILWCHVGRCDVLAACCAWIQRHANLPWLRHRTRLWGRVQLKCDGTRWRTGGEWKGKMANGVGSQYHSHYFGTLCIQHYYRWCAQFGCQQSTELKPPPI